MEHHGQMPFDRLDPVVEESLVDLVVGILSLDDPIHPFPQDSGALFQLGEPGEMPLTVSASITQQEPFVLVCDEVQIPASG